MKQTKELDISKFRGNNSTSFTGRPQGQEARKELNLDRIENDFDRIEIKIPKGTTAFNPSFFLGLFYKSIKNLGIEKFDKKFNFKTHDENPKRNERIRKNIEEGKRHAKNELKVH